jgi:hypothetical protein
LIESVVLFLIFNLNLKTTIQKISSTSTWDFRENLLCNLKKKKIRKKIVKSLTQEKLIEFVRLLADSTKIKLEIKIEDSIVLKYLVTLEKDAAEPESANKGTL